MPHPFFQINAFTSRPFAGNPAAVVRLDHAAPDTWMQLVARDFNLSETAFVHPREGSTWGQDEWNLRWLTPVAEVDLCGHATLAAAHALRGWNLIAGEEIRFHTKSGLLKARFDAWDDAGEITLDFPATPPESIEVPPGLLQVLGLDARQVLGAARSIYDIIVHADSEEIVARLQPDFAALKVFEARGVCVTAESSGVNCDFVSRFFGPRVGIDEDPVTGSAHCALGPFWQRQSGKDTFAARQISARGGELGVQVLGARVRLSGRCATILRGEILPEPDA